MAIYVLCPYFKSEQKRSITCEDTIREYTREEKSRILRDYCTSSWGDCPTATALNHIYNDERNVEVKLMEHTIEEQAKEINSLMREKGKISKRLDDLKEEIKKKDRIAAKNHELYINHLRTQKQLLDAKDAQIRWLESLASAFLITAFAGQEEIRIPKDKVMELMTKYTLKTTYDERTNEWVFNVTSN